MGPGPLGVWRRSSSPAAALSCGAVRRSLVFLMGESTEGQRVAVAVGVGGAKTAWGRFEAQCPRKHAEGLASALVLLGEE